MADDAWRRCRDSWPEPVPPAVILVPTTAAEARALADGRETPSARARVVSTPGGGGAAPAEPDATAATAGDATDPGTVAATTVVVGRSPSARARIHLSPTAWSSLTDEGQRVILTHECVHVALANGGRPRAPRWLVEGTAEHLAYRRSTVPVDAVLAPLWDRVAVDGPPASLPADADFETGGVAPDRMLLTYAEAATAAAVVADIHGEEALPRLLTVGPADGTGRSSSFRALERRILPRWQQALRRDARARATVSPAAPTPVGPAQP